MFGKNNFAISENVRIFAASNRQLGLAEESAFSLNSADSELGHFTIDYAGVRENECSLGWYMYSVQYLKWSLFNSLSA